MILMVRKKWACGQRHSRIIVEALSGTQINRYDILEKFVASLIAHASRTPRREKSKMKNDHGPNLTGSYLSTGMETGQSEDIILTTI
jgi:hypothetical protein